MFSGMLCLSMHVSPTHETTDLDNLGWCFGGYLQLAARILYLMTAELDTGVGCTMMQADPRDGAAAILRPSDLLRVAPATGEKQFN